MEHKHITAVVDLQFGSTGKGSMAAYLSLNGHNGIHFTAAATNWGPNAGHTSVYDDGHKIVRTMLANSVHRGSVERVYVGPGSAINVDALINEVRDSLMLGDNGAFKVYVHEHAAVVVPEHRAAETVHNRIGSTQKGTAQAWIDKMLRDGSRRFLAGEPSIARTLNVESGGVIEVVDHAKYVRFLWDEDAVLAEGCQGYSLGYSSGFWPYVTGRECTTAQLFADTLLPFHHSGTTSVIGCARTFPIRVANRYDANGNMVGYSGPCYPDQEETTFEAIGQETEYTTVTKLPRRIFTYSHEQVWQAVRANGVDEVFMNFMNYLPSTTEHRQRFVDHVNSAIRPARIRYYGHGPSTGNIGWVS